MENCRIKKTLNTVRICGCTPNENAIKVSNIVYADKPPNAIILVAEEKWQDAFAATPLIHFPRNAPILYTPKTYLDPLTVEQIFKLNPTGVDGVKVFIVGEFPYFIEEQLNMLGLRTKRIGGGNFYETAARVAEYLKYPPNIMVISGEDYREGLSTCAYAAHSGDVILFSDKNQLPWFTGAVIQSTENPNVFIVGSTNTISEKVEEEIRKLNVKFVDRISGSTPYEVSVNFAKYKSPNGQFGWGRNYRDGHAFTFTSIYSPYDSASSAPFGHLGKHTPILSVDPNNLPEVIKHYIESIKPIPQQEPKPPFMHGWIIGCDNTISYDVQIEIERALSIDEAHMSMDYLH
ncbi:cell wall-binding repeat-containing protein [Tissierella carlieri]|uniref:Cell wall-binding repeat-containing protein n=1 Tax=Tissierella carlieri TaxID=689904 RepID=A0ABT1SDZ9_9FIRM|nr:cell wall-binding repeat-containing protein [Tissierella carlieri]MBU5313498.1 cell wall-binding repeat-containing protein [Tissierella carlieri]MCQ4924714.1 cell wall-binding repeat-containing protein [Tissierella carlieri]